MIEDTRSGKIPTDYKDKLRLKLFVIFVTHFFKSNEQALHTV